MRIINRRQSCGSECLNRIGTLDVDVKKRCSMIASFSFLNRAAYPDEQLVSGTDVTGKKCEEDVELGLVNLQVFIFVSKIWKNILKIFGIGGNYQYAVAALGFAYSLLEDLRILCCIMKQDAQSERIVFVNHD